MRRDKEVVKRSGRDESIRVVIHKCMEVMLGISLYSYVYLKLAKTLYLSYYLFSKIGEQENGTGSSQRGWGKGIWLKQSIHMQVNVKTIK
jgi:hypothetical protein